MVHNDNVGPTKVAGPEHETNTAQELARLHAENERLRNRLQLRRDIRRWLSYVLVVLSSLLVVASTVAVWTYQTAFNTDRFMETVEPALSEPAFYSALSDRVSEEALAALELETRVTNRLNQLDDYISGALVDAIEVDPQVRDLLARFDRPTLAALAPPITSALEDQVTQAADRLITSEQFTTRFPNLVRQAHEASVALVRGDMAELPNVYIADGEVRLNLVPIIRDVLQEVIDELREFLPDVELPDVISDRVAEGREQLGAALQTQLPSEFGQATLMSQDALGEVQQTVHRLDQLMWLLLLVTVGVIAVTIAVSPTRRRTLLQLGVGVVIGFILGAVVIRRLQAEVLAQVATPDGERAAGTLLAATMSSLRNVVLLVGAIAVVCALLAYLAGRPTWVGRLAERGSQLAADSPKGSELDRWVARHYEKLRIAAIVVAVAIIFVTGLNILALLIVAGLFALFLWAISSSKRRVPPPDDPGVDPDHETDPADDMPASLR
jgi:hypothetical protein